MSDPGFVVGEIVGAASLLLGYVLGWWLTRDGDD